MVDADDDGGVRESCLNAISESKDGRKFDPFPCVCDNDND